MSPSRTRLVRDFVQGVVFWFIRLVHRDRKYYYSTYYGSNNPWMLLLKNLLRPKRYLTKFIYGQIVPLPVAISRGRALPEFTPSPDARNLCAQLKETGAVLLPRTYQDFANHLIKKFDMRPERYQAKSDYQSTDERTEDDVCMKIVDRRVLDVMVDDLVLQIFGLYWGRQPYVRLPPGVSICMPSFDQKTTRETLMANESFNMGWHYDTVNMLQFAILLNDVLPSGTHMQIARGDHRVHRVNMSKYDYYYSDEFAQDNCEVMPFVGPLGTAYLFDSNAIHRLFAVKSSQRMVFKVECTPGNSVVTPKLIFDQGVTVDHLTPLQRNSLRYLL